MIHRDAEILKLLFELMWQTRKHNKERIRKHYQMSLELLDISIDKYIHNDVNKFQTGKS